MDQTNLLENMVKFNNQSRPTTKESKDTFYSISVLYEGRELTLKVFTSGIFPIKGKNRKALKILTPKQMLQRLAIALAQAKAGNTFESLLIWIRQIISFYQAKEITKKVYNNIMNWIKV